MNVGGRFDLTYCSNIHAGESWTDVSTVLQSSLPRIRTILGVQGPFAIGLRLSGAAARELEEPAALERFREFLQAGSYYVPTINGFPYGAFHGTRVKERVYLPDWRSAERVDYTNRLARILAALAETSGVSDASISTVPGAFRAALGSDADVAVMAQNVLAHVAHAKRLKQETGITISLAIEPEPVCYIETVSEALAFFRGHLLRHDSLAAASRATGSALSAEDVITHAGLCLDACHMAVEFEDPADAIGRIGAEGLRIFKAQLSSAVRLVRRAGDPAARNVLGRFAEDTYLHQVVTSGEEGLVRYVDLPEALAAEDPSRDAEWRVHFHVPIFLSAMSGFDTTQSYLAGVLKVLDRTGICRCLEVETYTWDVLPPEYRTTDVCTAIARELAWVRSTLGY